MAEEGWWIDDRSAVTPVRSRSATTSVLLDIRWNAVHLFALGPYPLLRAFPAASPRRFEHRERGGTGIMRAQREEDEPGK